MSKFVIEPNKIYPVVDNSGFFFIRVIERWYSGYKVEIAPCPDLDDFSDSDLEFAITVYSKSELKHLFGSFHLDDSESDEEDNDDEEA